MSNLKYPKMTKNHLSKDTFKFLREVTLPADSPKEYYKNGIYLDKIIKERLGIMNGAGTVDVPEYHLEIKSKGLKTKSSWTIGGITLSNILNKSYIDSQVCFKLQCLLSIRRDDAVKKVHDYDIFRFDNDEVQELLCTAYETARQALRDYVNSRFDPENPEFDNYQTFYGENGGCFEYRKGTTFNFRISTKLMKTILNLSGATVTRNHFVEEL
jgi:hypothetical protein